jgi:hypothetical protein
MSDEHESTLDTDAEPSSGEMTFCSLFAEQSGIDPAGSAWANDRYLMIEIPLPWKYSIYESNKAPDGLKDYLYGLYDRGISVAGAAFAGDQEWSVAGHRRIMWFTQREGVLGNFERAEYLVPDARVTDAARTLIEEEDDAWLRPFRVDAPAAQRDIFVCTHGAIDACCATFGYPIYKLLRHMCDGAPMPLRAWRCSHFGGHQYAATILDLPQGRYWGHLKAQDLSAIIAHTRPFSDVRKKYRGWAAVPMGLAQVAEAKALEHFGWAWTECDVRSETLPAYIYGATPEPSTVAMAFTHPAGELEGEIVIDVAPDGFVTTMGSSGIDPETYDAQQYRADIREIRSLTPAGD